VHNISKRVSTYLGVRVLSNSLIAVPIRGFDTVRQLVPLAGCLYSFRPTTLRARCPLWEWLSHHIPSLWQHVRQPLGTHATWRGTNPFSPALHSLTIPVYAPPARHVAPPPNRTKCTRTLHPQNLIFQRLTNSLTAIPPTPHVTLTRRDYVRRCRSPMIA